MSGLHQVGWDAAEAFMSRSRREFTEMQEENRRLRNLTAYQAKVISSLIEERKCKQQEAPCHHDNAT